MKVCTRCNVEKDLENFSIRGKYRSSWCKRCYCDYEKEKRELRNSLGLCTTCDNAVTLGENLKCNTCSAKKKQQDKDRTQKGICHRCKNPVVILGNVRCAFHVVEQALVLATNKIPSKEDTQKMLDVLNSNPYCPYTGNYLELCKNVHLDHKNPKSSHPEEIDNLNNLQWISKQANMSKWNMTHEQFLDFCLKVVKHNNLV